MGLSKLGFNGLGVSMFFSTQEKLLGTFLLSFLLFNCSRSSDQGQTNQPLAQPDQSQQQRPSDTNNSTKGVKTNWGLNLENAKNSVSGLQLVTNSEKAPWGSSINQARTPATSLTPVPKVWGQPK